MAETSTLHRIPLERLRVSKLNIRKGRGDISELVSSIRAVGILEPIVVRAIGKDFEVIIGSRRFAAARKAGLKTVPAVVKELTDDQAILESLTENLQRGDLSEEEIVASYFQLNKINPKRWTQQAVADKLGKSQGWLGGILAAYHTVIKLEEAGVAKGMKSYPSQEERAAGIMPVNLAREIEWALRSEAVKKVHSENKIEKKRIELTKALSDEPFEDATKVLNRFKMYPEKPIPEIKEEALATSAGVALRTYVKPSVARQIEEKLGRPVGDAIPELIEKGLRATVQETQAPGLVGADEAFRPSDAGIITEVDTGYLFKCPVCKGSYHVYHLKPTNSHTFREVSKK